MGINRQSTAARTGRLTNLSTSQTVTNVVVDAGRGRMLTVRIGGEGDGTASQAEVTAITRDGQSGTRVFRSERSDWSWVEEWKIPAPNVGTADLVITLSETEATGGAEGGWWHIDVLQGVHLGTHHRTPATANGSSGTASCTVAGAAAGDWIDTVVCRDGGGATLTEGANQTRESTDDGITGCDVAVSRQAGADGGVMSFTFTTAPWSIGAVAWIPAPEPLITDRGAIEDVVSWGIGHQYQRGSFVAAGRDWVIWAWKGAGAHTAVWITSSDDDGATWEPSELIRELNQWLYGSIAYTDFYFDGTYLHYVLGGASNDTGETLLYRRGQPQSDGSIVWSAAEQVAFTGDRSLLEVGITADADGIPWITLEHFNNGSGVGEPLPKVTRASAADGTWTTAGGYPLTLSPVESHWWTGIAPLDDGGVFAFYWNDRLFDESGIGPTAFGLPLEATSSAEVELDADVPPLDRFGGGLIRTTAFATDRGSGAVYFTWTDSTDASYLYVGDQSGGIAEVVPALSDPASVAMGVDSASDDLIVAYIDDEFRRARYVRRSPGGVWSSPTTLFDGGSFESIDPTIQITDYGPRLLVTIQDGSLIRVFAIEGGGTTTVQADRALSYELVGPVQADRAVTYELAAPVHADRALSYELAVPVQADCALSYELAAPVVADRAITYEIDEGETVTVQADRTLSYEVQAPVQADRALTYEVAAPLFVDRGVLYELVAGVLADRIVSYELVAPVTADVRVAYQLGDTAPSTGPPHGEPILLHWHW